MNLGGYHVAFLAQITLQCIHTLRCYPKNVGLRCVYGAVSFLNDDSIAITSTKPQYYTLAPAVPALLKVGQGVTDDR